MKELAIVGVTHAVSMSTFAGFRTCEVEPPSNFMHNVSLDPNAAVALELFPGARELYAPGSFPDEADDVEAWYNTQLLKGGHFFRQLASNLRDAGVTVFEIDDPRLANTVPGRLARKLEKLSNIDYRNGDLSERQRYAAGHASALLAHINSTLKEDALFQNLAKVNADMVVIGQAHADRLISSEELQDQAGIKVVTYFRVTPDIDDHINPWAEPLCSRVSVPSLRQVEADARVHTIVRELDRRKYNAYAIGRVLGRDEPAPNFLGRLHISDCAADSLFELTIHERSGTTFSGQIKDVIGDAHIEGVMTKTDISFTKTYNTKTCEPGKNYQTLYYQGSLDEATGQYEGRYDVSTDDIKWGKVFTLRPFIPHAAKLLDLHNPGIIRD